MDDLEATIKRLEAATDGDDRKLADEVLKACGWTTRVDFPRPYPYEPAQTWIAPNGLEYDESVRPNPLGSIDAALTLARNQVEATDMMNAMTLKLNGTPACEDWKFRAIKSGLVKALRSRSLHTSGDGE